MLFARENYYNQTAALGVLQSELREKKEESPFKGRGSGESSAQEKKLMQQYMRVDSSKNDYEKFLIKINSTVDLFDTQYRHILNRI